MVEKFRTILNTIEARYGQANLFALLKMDGFVDKWTVVLSASWTTSDRRSEVFEFVRNEILTVLDAEEISEIARLAIYPEDEHLVQDLLKYKSGVIIVDEKVNGNIVHFAHIIKSAPIIAQVFPTVNS